MLNVRLFRGEIYCTLCHQERRTPLKQPCDLYRMEDGSYQGLCRFHLPKEMRRDEETGEEQEGTDYAWMRQHLAALEMCFHIPWRDVVKIILHKPDPNSWDRKGDVVTVVMKDVPNTALMREHAIEVLHGLQLMADRRATIHQWNRAAEQNDCWTDNNYSWEAPATARIRDKYWGDERIKNFHTLCRTMAEIHKWELEDETMPLLDRIVHALDASDAQENPSE
jgi:hypothetical protein